ncbi:MAG: hypothetical protein HYT16_03730 [DPANN group archaeon]|nr:hypothetical protein [DPANN group archaeon]
MENQNLKPKIKASMIVEIAGSPQEHINYALNLMSEQFCKDMTEVKILNKKVTQSEKMPQSERVFSGFCEFEIEVPDLAVLFVICKDYLPSSVEIYEPDSILFHREHMTEMFNDFAARLHDYDAMAKTLTLQKRFLLEETQKYITEKNIAAGKPKEDAEKEASEFVKNISSQLGL